MRVQIDRAPTEDRAGWLAYRWRSDTHTGVLWAEVDGDQVEGDNRFGRAITAIVLLGQHRRTNGGWPTERIVYAPEFPPPEKHPAPVEPVTRRTPVERKRVTLGDRAEAARRERKG